MNPIKRTVKAAALLIALFVLGCCISVISEQPRLGISSISNIYFLALGVVLTLYFSQTIVDSRLRKLLTAIGAMTILWFFFRTEKYVAFREVDVVLRQFWYLYYLPLLCMSQLSFMAALSVGMPKESKLPPLWIVTGIVSITAIALVLTNDLHQWVFSFDPGFANWDNHYFHELGYWFILVWDCLLMFASLGILLKKCTLAANRQLLIVLAIYIFLLAVWLLLLGTGLRPWPFGASVGNFPETVCFMVGGFWVLCIAMGLVPSGKGYGRLFSQSSLALAIADKDGNIIRRSSSVQDMTSEQMEAKESILLDKNTRLHRRAVTGGYVYWQVDETEPNRLNQELEEMRETLSEQAELLRLENELKERQALAETKSAVYDRIAGMVLPQSLKIKVLSAAALETPGVFEQNMRQIGVYGVYIKRMANLMLLNAQEEYLARDELTLALKESLRYLNRLGVVTWIETDDASQEDVQATPMMLLGEDLINAYQLFQELLDSVLLDLQALHIVLIKEELRLTFEGATPALPLGSFAQMELDEGTAFVRIALRGGEGA